MTRSSVDGSWLVRITAIAVMGALAALVPLCHSSPPDPSWIAGFYDDADYDDIVLAITGAAGLPTTHGQTVLLTDGSRRLILPCSSAELTKPLRIAQVDRSPPLA